VDRRDRRARDRYRVTHLRVRRRRVSARRQYDPANGTEDAFLVKIDVNGTQLWQKTFGGAGNDDFTAIDKAAGGFILTGYTATGPNATSRLLLMKVDMNGTKVFEANFSGRGEALGLDALETPDGSFIAVGLSAADSRSPKDIYLVKVDRAGNRLWEKCYGGNGEDRGFAIVGAADGGYVVAGAMIRPGATTGDAYLLKIDAEGDCAWEKFTGATTETRSDSTSTAPRTAAFSSWGALSSEPDSGTAPSLRAPRSMCFASIRTE